MSDLDQLERSVARDREALARDLDQLSTTLAPDEMANRLKGTVEGYSGEISRQVAKAAKGNPAALTLIGTGLLLMLSGGRSQSRPASSGDTFDERVAKADAEIKSRMTGEYEVEPRASRLSATLDHGLEHLPKPARDRVLRARRAALAAQSRLERRAARLKRQSSSLVKEQPLVAGALAAGFGAIVASLLPGTRRENELLGARRDALFAQAQDVLNHEVSKAKAAAENAIDRRAGTARRA